MAALSSACVCSLGGVLRSRAEEEPEESGKGNNRQILHVSHETWYLDPLDLLLFHPFATSSVLILW